MQTMLSRFSLTLIITSLFLWSCTFGTSDTQEAPIVNSGDFSTLYTAHIRESVWSLRSLAKDMGYMESYRSKGLIRLMVDVPAFLSGSLTSGFDAKVRAQDAEILFKSPTLAYKTFLASGSIMADSITMITSAGDSFFRYDGLRDDGIFATTADSVIEKYKNIWLSLKQADIMKSLSGSSTDEILSYKLSQSISRMTLTDIETYLTKYPLWKVESDLGMKGNLHTFSVSLARENITALISDFTIQATGQDLDPTARKDIKTMLDSMSITGTLSYDPKDAKRIVFDGVISTWSGGSTAIAFEQSQNSSRFTLRNTRSTISYDGVTSPTEIRGTLSVTDGTTELARIEGTKKTDTDASTLIHMVLTAPSQGLTLTLDHKNQKNGDFLWSLNAGIGNLSWSGGVASYGLSSFYLSGVMPGSTLSMNLWSSASNGTIQDNVGLITGPLTIKSDDATIIAATIGLKANINQFLLSLDVASPEDPSVRSKGLIDISGSREAWDGKIAEPAESQSLQKFSDELSALLSSWDELDSGSFREISDMDKTYPSSINQ